MDQRIDLVEVRAAFRRGNDLVAVHYGCENLYTATDHPAAVSCIAFCRIGRSDAGSFSVVDYPGNPSSPEPEIAVLREYFAFAQQNSGAAIVHWNMGKPDYGFSALEARYRFLAADDPPYRVPRDRTFDLDDLIAHEHGTDYAPHPRLISIAALNGLSRHHALTGGEEAEKFASGDHGSVRRSIDEKARWIADLSDHFLSGRLKTLRSVGSLDFGGSHLDAVQVVIQIGRRFLYVQRELAKRHDNRPTLEVTDEYDAQDLFRALLRVFFEDIRPEDYTPAHAGASSRIDFVLPEFELAVELKYSRVSMTAKTLGDELIVDVARYGDRHDIRHLICLVFDHEGHLDNPRGMEADLSRKATTGETAVSVVILDR
jgi:hypothetical protein